MFFANRAVQSNLYGIHAASVMLGHTDELACRYFFQIQLFQGSVADSDPQCQQRAGFPVEFCTFLPELMDMKL